MIQCTFHLNGRGLSNLSCPGIGFFPAYSGNEGGHRNNPDSVAVKGIGPLPPGRYYIVDRPTGGLGTSIRDSFYSGLSGSDRDVWFALYRDDGSVDDITFIDGVSRGLFRLHPAGYVGVSNGCITLPSRSHYSLLHKAIMRTPKFLVSGSLYAYGTIQVY